ALREAEGPKLGGPSTIGGKSEPALNQAIDGILHQDFGEDELIFDGGLEFADRFLTDAQQISTAEAVLVRLDPLENERLILLFQGRG
ncbi:MAG: hypothetical protein ABJC74_12305, partial [Gemmatimonadota bacterium]